MERTSTRPSKAAPKDKTLQEKDEGATSPDKLSRLSDPKKPATKASVPPKRPLTTPRGPSFTSDRSRAKASAVSSSGPTSKARPASKASSLNKGTGPASTGARRRSTTTPKQSVPSTTSRATPPPSGAPQENNNESVASPTATEDSQQNGDDIEEVEQKEGANDQEIVADPKEIQDRKEDEVTRLSEEMEYLKSSLMEKTEEAKRQSNARVVDLESELEDSQTKLRQIEADAESIREELLVKSKDNDDLRKRKEELEEKLNSSSKEREKELRDADRRHAQQLKDAASKLELQAKRVEEDLRDTIARQEREHKEAEAQHEGQIISSLEEKQKELEELQAKHKEGLQLAGKGREGEFEVKLQRVREDSEAQIVKARKELEQARKVAKDAETTRTALQQEIEEARKKAEAEKSSKMDLEKELDGLEALRQELEDQQATLKREHEHALEKTKKELAEVWKRLEEEKKDSTDYERELADLRASHDRELQDKSSDLQKMQDDIVKHEDYRKTAKAEEERMVKEAEAKGEQKLADTLKQIQRLEEASLEHEQHFRNTVQKHRKDLEEHDKDHEQVLKERLDKQKELEYAVQQSKRELGDALKHQSAAHLESDQSKKAREAALKSQEDVEISLKESKKQLEEALKREEKAQDTIDSQANQLEEAARTEKERQEARENERQMETKSMGEWSQRLQDLERQISEQKKRHEKEIDEARQKHNDLEGAAVRFSKELEEALHLQRDSQNRSSVHLKALEEAQGHREKVTKDLSLAEETVASLRHEQTKQIADLASKHEDELSVLRSNHVQEIRGLQDTVAELGSLVDREKPQEVDSSAIDDAKAQHQQEVDNLKSKHHGQQEIAAKRILEYRDALQKANEAKEAAEKAKADLEAQSQESQEKAISGANEFQALKKSHEESLEQIVALQASLDKAANDRKEGIEMIRSQKNKLEAAEQANADLQKQLDETSGSSGKESESLQQEHAAAIQEINALKGSLANATNEKKQTLDLVHSHKKELETAEKAKLDIAKQLREFIATKENELEKLKRDQEDALQQQVAALKTSADRASDERKEGVEFIRGLKKQITELSKERDAAHDKITKLESLSTEFPSPKDNAEVESLQREYQAAREKAVTLQAAVDGSIKDREADAKMTRDQKKKLQDYKEKYSTAETSILGLQAALSSSRARDAREGNAVDFHIAEKKKIEQERDAAKDQISSLQAYCRIVDAERNELASAAAPHASALGEANRKFTQLLEEAAKAKAIAARKEHELSQRLSHLDIAHSEALANATSLAQQLHNAKAHHADVDDLTRQLEKLKQEKESMRGTDHVELKRHIGALGRQYAVDFVDVETLRADMKKEREERERGWRRGAEGRKRLLGELESVRAVLANPVGGLH